MASPKIKLFETVMKLHDKGAATLTASEKSLIEQETRALLNAVPAKYASKAPEGFENLLKQLQKIEDAGEAYEAVLSFLKDKGELGKGEKKDKEEKPFEKKLDKEDDKEEKSEKKDKLHEMKESPEEEAKEEAEEKSEKAPKFDMAKEKSEIFAKSKKLSLEQADNDLEELREDDKEGMSAESMGIKDAARLQARVTEEGNIVVSRDGLPLFYHTTAAEVKKNATKLRRLANKLLAWTMHEGAVAAAKKSGSRLVAGVDADIILNSDVEVPEAKDSPTENGTDLIRDELETPPSSALEGADTDTQTKNDKVEASKGKKARRVKRSGADDGIDIAVKEDMDNNVNKATEGGSDEIEESKASVPSDTQEGADVDFQSVEANLKTLYKNRAAKEADVKVDAFIEKFIRAYRIASTRMLLNHDEHQFKAAAYDVLTDDSVVEGMDEGDAAEISEMIASKAHKAFEDQILERTASLMKKSDQYLKDAEADLATQSVRPSVIAERRSASMSRKASNLRREASEGNFALKTRASVSRSANTTNDGGLRSVVGNTVLGKLASRLTELKGQR